jgi:hypothetical protein
MAVVTSASATPAATTDGAAYGAQESDERRYRGHRSQESEITLEKKLLLTHSDLEPLFGLFRILGFRVQDLRGDRTHRVGAGLANTHRFALLAATEL